MPRQVKELVMKSPKLTWAFAAALLAIVPATSFPGIMFATSTDSSLLGGLTSLPFDPKTADVSDYCPYATCSGDFEFRTGSVTNGTNEPGTDSSIAFPGDIFLTVPKAGTTADAPFSATLEVEFTASQFGMLWGSVDSDNTLAFLLGETVVGSGTGNEVNGTHGGSGNFNIDRFVLLTGIEGTVFEFDATQFDTTNFAFETADHRVSVPEPMSLSLLGFGLLAMGLMARRWSGREA
jgi:hypothetical protein